MELWWNPWVIHIAEPAAKAICHALALSALVRRAHLLALYPWLGWFLAVQCLAVACETVGLVPAVQALWLVLIPLKIRAAFEVISRLSDLDARGERSGVALTGFCIGAFVVIIFAMRWHPWPGESWPVWIIEARIACDVILMFATVYAALYFRLAFYVVSRPPAAAHAWLFAAFMATSLFKVPLVTEAQEWWMLHGLFIAWQCAVLLAWRAAIQTPKFDLQS